MVPSLSLDFLSGVLDSRITFTRSTSGTYYKNGVVTTASANVPRFQTNPITGESQGLLLENNATNLVCGSQTFATSGGANNWIDSSITRDATLPISPDGTNNALRILAAAGNATILNNLSLASAARTFSIWIRRVTGTGNVEMTMDGGTSWTALAITSAWTRFQMTATTTAHVGIRIVASGDEIELWGAQVETGAFATSYILTVASTVARGLDSVSISGSALSAWFNPNEGTIFTDHDASASSGVARWVASIGSSNANFIEGLRYVSTNVARAIVTASSATQADITSTLTSATVRRSIFAYRVNDFALCLNGESPQFDTSGSLPTTGLNPLYIGRYHAGSSIQGFMRRFVYWPIRLPNSTLQNLTA